MKVPILLAFTFRRGNQSPSKHIYKQENVITVSVMRKTKLDNMVETGKGLLELGRLKKASLTGKI